MCYCEHNLELIAEQADSGIANLNGVCYCEHTLEDTTHLVDSFIVGGMDCVTMNIIWNLLHCRWKVDLQVEWSVLV